LSLEYYSTSPYKFNNVTNFFLKGLRKDLLNKSHRVMNEARTNIMGLDTGYWFSKIRLMFSEILAALVLSSLTTDFSLSLRRLSGPSALRDNGRL
jgi:hypothetical protein